MADKSIYEDDIGARLTISLNRSTMKISLLEYEQISIEFLLFWLDKRAKDT